MKTQRTLSISMARRLAIVAQRLAGTRPRPDREGILDTVRALRRLQLDPTNAVARSHLLVLWSRFGTYDPTDLDALLWSEKRLFEYVAYIVPTEDYPVYQYSMRRFGTGQSLWRQRVRTFMGTNHGLRRHILASLRQNGPLSSRQFEDRSVTSWRSTGWTRGRAVHAKPDAPMSHTTGRKIARAIESLASFLGAREIAYGKRIPSGWKKALT